VRGVSLDWDGQTTDAGDERSRRLPDRSSASFSLARAIQAAPTLLLHLPAVLAIALTSALLFWAPWAACHSGEMKLPSR
jgi:hypothetical protein